jgi:hypothetical protein
MLAGKPMLAWWVHPDLPPEYREPSLLFVSGHCFSGAIVSLNSNPGWQRCQQRGNNPGQDTFMQSSPGRVSALPSRLFP